MVGVRRRNRMWKWCNYNINILSYKIMYMDMFLCIFHVCMHMHMHVPSHIYMYMYNWKPEVNLRSFFLRSHWLLSFLSFYFFLRFIHLFEYSDTPEEGFRSHYSWLWATMWLLGFELRTSGRAVGALNLWAISPAPERLILFIWIHCSCFQAHQKRASDLITDGCEPPCGCWDLNSGPLEEQSVLLTTEPSLQTWDFNPGN